MAPHTLKDGEQVMTMEMCNSRRESTERGVKTTIRWGIGLALVAILTIGGSMFKGELSTARLEVKSEQNRTEILRVEMDAKESRIELKRNQDEMKKKMDAMYEVVLEIRTMQKKGVSIP